MKSITNNEIKPLKFQNKILQKINREEDYLITAPTGSGKTLFAYSYCGILDNSYLENRKINKIIFTAPIKALSNERYRELKKENHDVGIETGDVKSNTNAKILCVTQEILLEKYYDIKNCYIIIDEIHYFFKDPERTKSYLTAIEMLDSSNRLMLLSATIKNYDKLLSYLTNLTHRNFNYITHNNRLTEIEYIDKGIDINDIPKNSVIFSFSVRDINNIIEDATYNMKKMNIKIIKKIQNLCNNLNIEYRDHWDYGISEYYGKLLPKEKLLIEYLYRKNIFNILVGTDSLSLGVNLPFEYVIFSTLVKNNKLMSKSEYLQMSGRAGRYGYYDKGFISWLYDDTNANNNETKEDFKHINRIKMEDLNFYAYPDVINIINNDATLLPNSKKYMYPVNDNNICEIEKYIIDTQRKINGFITYVENDNMQGNDINLNLIFSYINSMYFNEFDINENFNIFLYMSLYYDVANKETFYDFFENYIRFLNMNIGEFLYHMLLFRKFIKHNIEKSIFNIEHFEYVTKYISSIDESVFDPDYIDKIEKFYDNIFK